jgi:hypothetical protein
MGIPSITYGPPRGYHSRSMEVGDLVRAAQAYARIALGVCMQEKTVPPPPKLAQA